MAVYTLRSGGTQHPEDSVLQFLTDLITTGGVKDLSGTNHLKVVERGAGPNMSVDISVGRGYIKGSGNSYPVRNTTAINAVIGANTSGNPRKDAIVLYVDLAEAPNTDSSDVIKTAVVQGTPAASPSAPTDGDIQTAVGGSNPFLRLANVTVANGETEINTGDIQDTRVAIILNTTAIGFIDEDDMVSNLDTKVPTQQSVKAYVDSGTVTMTNKRIVKRVTTTASSATPTPNADTTDQYQITALAEAAELQAPSGTPNNGQALVIRIKDNGTARPLTYNSIYRAIGVLLPSTTVINKTLYLGVIYNSADTKWDCVAVSQQE